MENFLFSENGKLLFYQGEGVLNENLFHLLVWGNCDNWKLFRGNQRDFPLKFERDCGGRLLIKLQASFKFSMFSKFGFSRWFPIRRVMISLFKAAIRFVWFYVFLSMNLDRPRLKNFQSFLFKIKSFESMEWTMTVSSLPSWWCLKESL